jgi:hypothetical protein
MVYKMTVGADPEIFLKVRDLKNIFQSAEGLIGGTKEEPIVISQDGCAVQEDNVMVEYNIPPVDNYVDFVKYNKKMLKHISDVIPEYLEIAINASAEFMEEQLSTEQAMTFGCDPDFNAWTGTMNASPKGEGNLRTCGGHIHVGYEMTSEHESKVEVASEIIKAMDLFLGLPSIIIDCDSKRRTMYGKAGSFRYQDYGVEYRTLSNFWLSSEELMQWAYENTNLAIKWINNPETKIRVEDYTNIIDAIDNSNITLAEMLLERYSIPYPNVRVNEKVKTK